MSVCEPRIQPKPKKLVSRTHVPLLLRKVLHALLAQRQRPAVGAVPQEDRVARDPDLGDCGVAVEEEVRPALVSRVDKDGAACGNEGEV